jgi:PAS domain-containing protein
MKDENKTKVGLIKELKTLGKERGKSALNNITERKQVEIREKQLVTKMDFLYKTALDFIQLDPKDDIYRFIGRKQIKKVLKIIGKDLFTMSFPINNEEAKSQLISGELLKVPGGLYELTFGQIPKSICHVLEKFLNVGEIYFSGFAKGKELFGDTIIILPKKVELNNREFINTFIKQAAIALQKKQAEEGLKDSEERLKILFDYAPDAYYINDLKGNFVDGNKAAERVIGYKKEELIGKSFLKLNLLTLADIPKAAKTLAKNIIGKPTGPDEFILNAACCHDGQCGRRGLPDRLGRPPHQVDQ